MPRHLPSVSTLAVKASRCILTTCFSPSPLVRRAPRASPMDSKLDPHTRRGSTLLALRSCITWLPCSMLEAVGCTLLSTNTETTLSLSDQARYPTLIDGMGYFKLFVAVTVHFLDVIVGVRIIFISIQIGKPHIISVCISLKHHPFERCDYFHYTIHPSKYRNPTTPRPFHALPARENPHNIGQVALPSAEYSAGFYVEASHVSSRAASSSRTACTISRRSSAARANEQHPQLSKRTQSSQRLNSLRVSTRTTPSP